MMMNYHDFLARSFQRNKGACVQYAREHSIQICTERAELSDAHTKITQQKQEGGREGANPSSSDTVSTPSLLLLFLLTVVGRRFKTYTRSQF